MRDEYMLSLAVFPACAGLILRIGDQPWPEERIPRMCGADPDTEMTRLVCDLYSPHVRG